MSHLARSGNCTNFQPGWSEIMIEFLKLIAQDEREPTASGIQEAVACICSRGLNPAGEGSVSKSRAQSNHHVSKRVLQIKTKLPFPIPFLCQNIDLLIKDCT